ncbi:MAG: penicillin-binding protein [Clostridiales bacterium]|nr:penicillin-binding protein [Clostridiales bacterium]
MKKILKICLFLILTISVIIITFLISFYFATINAKLNPENFTNPSNKVQICSNLGNEIAVKNAKNNVNYVNIEDINDYTKNAFIAIEDRRFYSHNGVDYVRILGATLNNIKSFSFKEGASTITQQLVKNTHLSSEKTILRKLKEIKISLQVEKTYEKDKILELYLNSIYFGKGAYGIENASNLYFSKSAKDLTVNESALLAGIIKAPNKYSPITNYDQSISRKNVVLKAMLDCEYITNENYERLVKSKVNLNYSNENDYFSDYVNAVILEYENSNYFNPYAKNVKINTFLDEDLQVNINKYKTENYSNSKIVIDNKTHGIIAYFGKNSNMKRSPASCVKPWLVYAPMINDGFIKESSVIKDEKVSINGYSPKNYNGKFNGNVTVKTALSDSLNVPPVKLLNDFTVEKANKYTSKMGVNIKDQSISCALGSISDGLSLKDLSDCYSVFNNDGNYIKSSFIESVYVNNVKIYQYKPKSTSVFSEETAFIINDALKYATKNGTSKKLRSLPYDICAKTGTNGNENGNFDALTISYTTDHIIGVWIGNEDNSLIPNSVTGGNQPTQIAYNILSKVYEEKSPLPFETPSNIVKLKIDNEILLNDNVEVISEDGEPYCYIKGTEPKIYYDNYVLPNVTNTKINVKNSLVTLNFATKNANFIQIDKTYNGVKTTVYKGVNITEYKEYLQDFGIYNYSITVKNGDKTATFNYPSINYLDKNHSILSNDKWLTL